MFPGQVTAGLILNCAAGHLCVSVFTPGFSRQIVVVYGSNTTGECINVRAAYSDGYYHPPILLRIASYPFLHLLRYLR
eukprot:3247000-Rhodomonas_salina.1